MRQVLQPTSGTTMSSGGVRQVLQPRPVTQPTTNGGVRQVLQPRPVTQPITSGGVHHVQTRPGCVQPWPGGRVPVQSGPRAMSRGPISTTLDDAFRAANPHGFQSVGTYHDPIIPNRATSTGRQVYDSVNIDLETAKQRGLRLEYWFFNNGRNAWMKVNDPSEIQRNSAVEVWWWDGNNQRWYHQALASAGKANPNQRYLDTGSKLGYQDIVGVFQGNRFVPTNNSWHPIDLQNVYAYTPVRNDGRNQGWSAPTRVNTQGRAAALLRNNSATTFWELRDGRLIRLNPSRTPL